MSTKSQGKGLWKKICMGRARYQSCINWKARKGDQISFWQDQWLKGGVVRDQYPQFFAITQQNEILGSESFRDIE